MRELTFDEVEIVTGGLLGAGPGGDVSYSHPVLGEVGDVGAAVATTLGAGLAVAMFPALPVVVVVALGVACGVYIADEVNDLL